MTGDEAGATRSFGYARGRGPSDHSAEFAANALMASLVLSLGLCAIGYKLRGTSRVISSTVGDMSASSSSKEARSNVSRGNKSKVGYTRQISALDDEPVEQEDGGAEVDRSSVGVVLD